MSVTVGFFLGQRMAECDNTIPFFLIPIFHPQFPQLTTSTLPLLSLSGFELVPLVDVVFFAPAMAIPEQLFLPAYLSC